MSETLPISKIELIKFIRTYGRVSLIDAKHIVEAMHNANLVKIELNAKVRYPMKAG